MNNNYSSEDILYLSENLSNLCGIPVRIYQNKTLITVFSTINIIKDPVLLVLDELFEQEENLSYITTRDLWNYCTLKFKNYHIIVGPFSSSPNSNQNIMDLAFKLDISKENLAKFISSMSSIAAIPLGTVLQSLTSFNYLFNGEKVNLEDLFIKVSKQEENTSKTAEEYFQNVDMVAVRNSTLQIEETITKFVEDGDLDGFKKWIKKAPSIRAGEMSSDLIRQQKNTFIVSATLFSRAAIKSGVTYNHALDLTDSYIYRCENARTIDEISNLNYSLVVDFIKLVKQIKDKESPLESKVYQYIKAHLSQTISLDELCSYLYMTKSNLCLRFKKETGKTVSHYILAIKIEESKKLLSRTNKSLSTIAIYLGFSSQAHYSMVFKEITGISPLKYRNSKDKS